MTRVGEQGLTYNSFHVTALCSPTRAALLTGRNHHTVGFGSIGEFPGPFPGYSASVPKDCAPFVRALQGNGYSIAGSASGTLLPITSRGRLGLSTAGPTRGASITSGGSSAARPASTTP